MDVCIRDISSRGMLIQASTPPPRGTYVEIVRPGCSVTGRVVWAKHHKFGIEAQDRIRISAVLDRRSRDRGTGGVAPLNQARSPPPQRRADPVQQAARSRAFGAALQYAALGGAVTFGALLLAAALYSGLSGTFADVLRHLR